MSFVRVIPFLLVLILISGMNAKKLKKEVNNSLLLLYLKIEEETKLMSISFINGISRRLVLIQFCKGMGSGMESY